MRVRVHFDATLCFLGDKEKLVTVKSSISPTDGQNAFATALVRAERDFKLFTDHLLQNYLEFGESPAYARNAS